jgi:hypothetical protein
MSENMFEEYGVVKKSPMELIEEFAVQMMMQHQIYVTEINFNEQSAIDKMSLVLQPKERVAAPDPAVDARVSRVWSSAGRIKLGVAEGPKE